ncbi:MAG TPA: hypothetical protein VFQ20_12660 [Burkholderiaceae bacterium]|nr:hypothetical protein [Burkholderiaceae bacterium]
MNEAAVLDGLITTIEERLHALGAALRDRDAGAIEREAAELHRALSVAIHRFAHAARTPEGVAPALRLRLARASGLVAAQRESLARATAALDRAIDVLMPGALPAVYGRAGQADRAAASTQLSASA